MLVSLIGFSVYGQQTNSASIPLPPNTQDYYVSIKAEYSLGEIIKSRNIDQTLHFTLNNSDFADFLNSKSVYYFEKAFPTALLEKNKQVYKAILDDDSHLSDFNNRVEVLYAELIEEFEIELLLPNDYEYLDRDGANTALELIKAPQAWYYTKGDVDVVAGVVDTQFNLNHEDLVNKINSISNSANTNPAGNGNYHGAMVSTTLAGDTNNGVGIASIGYDTNLIITSGNITRVLELSQQPGVRVINISMKWGCDFSQATEDVFEEIWNGNEFYPPVVVIAAAGNGKAAQASPGNNGYCGEDGNGYVYPAAYDHVIAVSALGHLVPRGTTDVTHSYGVGWEDVARSDINNPNSTTTHNDKVDLSAPGRLVLSGNIGYDNYIRASGTSIASPVVTGTAALVLSVNPNLTSDEVRDILKSTTDDIYHIPENVEYTGLYGTGRLNAYRAVMLAKCLDDPNFEPSLDLMVRNSVLDHGEEPDNNTQNNVYWDSPDIWVRNQQDGVAVRIHQNPVHSVPNYVYVRVTSRSCVTSTPSDELTLYWGKASTGNGWPDLWMGNVQSPVPLGGLVNTLSIPALEPGQEAILEFSWVPPNPAEYNEITEDYWHFCFLATIESNQDPLITNGHIQKNSNNIAMKNLTVVDAAPTASPSLKPGGAVMIGNVVGDTEETYGFEFFTPETDAAIFEEAEVVITLNPEAYNRWINGGAQAENIEVRSNEDGGEYELQIIGNHARLTNMNYNAGEWDILNLIFNFLTEEVSGKPAFEYYVAQIDVDAEAIGGETYLIYRDPERPLFDADGHGYENTATGETEMVATDIGEPAVYNWYAPDGELLHSGKDFSFVPQVPGDYLLEVIAEADGHKDYFKLTLSPNQAEDQILSLSPNPASNTVAVAYQIDGNASTASVTIASFFGSATQTYPIDLNNNNNNSLNINLSNYPPGHYAVILTVDGQNVHAKQLIIN